MKNSNSIYGYLIVAILGAFFCFLILNALGWQKPGKERITTEARTEMAIEWVNTHPKPIIITGYLMWDYHYKCMFRDSSGIVFYAGKVNGFKPDTIK